MQEAEWMRRAKSLSGDPKEFEKFENDLFRSGPPAALLGKIHRCMQDEGNAFVKRGMDIIDRAESVANMCANLYPEESHILGKDKVLEKYPIIKMARQYAFHMHRDQRRANGTTAYISHAEAVVEMLVHHGCEDAATIAAAWLHDVVEDGHCSQKDIERFGYQISDLVDELTKKSDQKSEDYWLAMSPKAVAVKLADRLHNLLDSRNGDFDKKRMDWYRRNTRRMIEAIVDRAPSWATGIVGRIHEEIERQERE